MDLPYHTPLTPALQTRLGLDPTAPLAMADRVRFSELDVLNHVNNAVYMQWFERLRIRYTQDWGLSRYMGAGHDPRIVIRSGQIHYRQEMRMDEDYIVTCGCTAFRTTSFSLAQALWAGGTLRATFDCVLVLLTADGAARYPIPEAVRARFIAVDGAHEETARPGVA
ncbi:acyl-CoA thioesterase [Roseobacter sinensis]|uniref:Acyl-CoA thioesterase n=1 Tax=Roseobacter sinensis TaxID=2931391 RepID=A0ABT3BBD9_9RHOB|nr:acyl-CoA thioesterase [Roseobacter sp. WL0113]MCV3270886.1 acyl-CoA thioesterase [Roseobacter sp. WL0113]